MKLTEEMVDKYLEELILGFDQNDPYNLRRLSNKLIEEAISVDDRRMIDLSLVSYALSKLMLKSHFVKSKEWEIFKKKLLTDLRDAKQDLKTKKDLPKILNIVIKDITEFDREAGRYATDVIRHARVKQASRAYALGVSLTKAASLTGVSKKELLDYVGVTKIHEHPFTQTMDLKERYDIAKKVLEG